MPDKRLPLLDLFQTLREADLPLGIDEYRLMLRALQHGFGADPAALRRVCLALWGKTPQEQRLVGHHFDRWLKTQQAGPAAPPPGQTADRTDPARRKVSTTAPGVTPPPGAAALGTESPNVQAETTPAVEPETRFAFLQEALAGGEAPPRRFVLSGEYFPVTARQMKQAWRFLRQMRREGPATQLNLPATVEQIGRQGFLLDPVLEPPRVNRTDLLLLIDVDGSMAPFHALGERLVETALRGGRLEQAGVRYFHNLPGEHLYCNRYLIEAEKINSLLERLRPDRSLMLVFSDAGAARGNSSPERAEATAAWLKVMGRNLRRVAWLNPMPQERWKYTTAGLIARQAPMFEFSRRGLDGAIDWLRGRGAAAPVSAPPGGER